MLLPAFAAAAPERPWTTAGPDGAERVHLYVFWSKHCPHCRDAMNFLDGFAPERPWLVVHRHQIAGNEANAGRYVRMAERVGETARYVPAFIACGRMITGFSGPESAARRVSRLLASCRAGSAAAGPGESPETTVAVPGVGEVDPGSLSLPVLAVVLGGLDAFNPCAFFVLLFLLSLLVHARSRGRMLLIGGLFVLVSGVVYFLFMAAWLNLFLVLGGFRAVTAGAGAAAVIVAALNIKDFFRPRAGPGLGIPDAAKPGLFRRMRGLVGETRMVPLLVGTLGLAVAANAYELLCTAGFPMVFTRALTLRDPGGTAHYAYLVLYNAVYVLPLLLIVLGFTFALGGHKLQEHEGRALKLLSGLMMLGLGGLLLAAPGALSDVRAALGVLAGAALATAGLVVWDRRRSA